MNDPPACQGGSCGCWLHSYPLFGNKLLSWPGSESTSPACVWYRWENKYSPNIESAHFSGHIGMFGSYSAMILIFFNGSRSKTTLSRKSALFSICYGMLHGSFQGISFLEGNAAFLGLSLTAILLSSSLLSKNDIGLQEFVRGSAVGVILVYILYFLCTGSLDEPSSLGGVISIASKCFVCKLQGK